MNRLLYIGLLFPLAVLSACGDGFVPEGTGKMYEISGFKARLEGGEMSRTSLTYSQAGGTPTAPVVTWTAGDKVTVLSSDGNQSEFSAKLDETFTTTAVFDGYLASSLSPFFAMYPHSLGASLSDGYLHFSLSQTQGASTTATGVMPSIACITDPSASDIVFRNFCSLLRVPLTCATAVGKIELYDLGGSMLWGDVALEANADLSDPAAWKWTLSGGDNRLVLNFATPRTPAGENYYFIVPPGTLSNGIRLVVYDGSGNAIDEFCAGGDLSAARSHIKPMPAVTATNCVLLDLDGGANCYIPDLRNTSAVYKFCAISGNSGSPVPAASAETLWETINGNSTFNGGNVGYVLTNVSLSAGCVSFRVNGHPGNAVIAAKNGSGNITWSWHIWLPGGGSVGSATLGNGTRCMDRNLGALAASTQSNSIGLLYQWGRKDPFTGPWRTTGFTTALMVTSPSDVIVSELKTDATIGWSVLHPTVIVDKETIGYWDSENLADWDGTVKSQYDPCPPGWRVPSQAQLSGLEFGAWDGTEHAYTETASGLVFAGTGRRYYAPSLTSHTVESSQTGRYWTRTHGVQQAAYYYTAEDNVFSPTNINKHMCLGVRCVSE
ncbi:MAG: hypothetical protein IJS62_05650 [Bacteroidales bacterium]|nr:hypothetical protein [Bacteroidales bacterium]